MLASQASRAHSPPCHKLQLMVRPLVPAPRAPRHISPFIAGGAAFLVARSPRGFSMKRCAAETSEGKQEDEEEEETPLQLVLNLATVIADEAASLVPVAGPIRDGLRAAEEGRLWDYCYHVAMLLCDVTPLVIESEAMRMAGLSSKVAKMVRQGKKGYSLRKVAAAAKQLSEDAELARKLSPQVRMVLKVVHKVCVRLMNESSEKDKS
ncbi:unnamed protein product [Symbiodinium sp. CCMP2456]|nr:unnamed protein product [Symbiodinium sp. CCMP2456]